MCVLESKFLYIGLHVNLNCSSHTDQRTFSTRFCHSVFQNVIFLVMQKKMHLTVLQTFVIFHTSHIFQGIKLSLLSSSHLAPKCLEVVSNSKKLVLAKIRDTRSGHTQCKKLLESKMVMDCSNDFQKQSTSLNMLMVILKFSRSVAMTSLGASLGTNFGFWLPKLKI